MWAITPDGLGRPVAAREIGTGWALVQGEFEAEAWEPGLVLAEDGMSLRMPTAQESLAQERGGAKTAIDTSAGEARARFPSPGALVEMEYKRAEEQAAAFKAAGYPSGAAPSCVASWAAVKGWTPQQAADDILATAAGWYAVMDLIRDARLRGKQAVDAAADAAGVEAALAAAIAELAAIRP